MQSLNRFLPPLIVAALIAAMLPVVPAADDDPPTTSSPTKKTPPKTPGPKTTPGQQTPSKGPLFGPNPGAKPPMPTDHAADNPAGEDAADPFGEPLPKTLQEWRSRLTAEQFQITRMKGTERAFTGKYWKTDTAGTYKCVCCGEPLFTSGDKFLSECGWPAFSAPIDKKANGKVAETADVTFGMRRVEVTCRKCTFLLACLTFHTCL